MAEADHTLAAILAADAAGYSRLMAADDRATVVALYNVDPDWIAAGGHSTGAAAVVNAVFGLRAEVKAVIPLSPGVGGFDLAKVFQRPNLPARLVMRSEYDLVVSAETILIMLAEMRTARHPYQFAWVPGFGHFYPSGAVSLGDDATRTSAGERTMDFLADNL